MATVLLSKCTNTFYGIYMSDKFGTLTPRSDHPASPVLLTRNGPLATLIPIPRFIQAIVASHPFKV